MPDNHFAYKVEKSSLLEGVTVITGTKNEDLRGIIYSPYQKNFFENLIPDEITFLHDKFSISKKSALHGLHGDEKTWKLVSCVAGRIFQVVVDCRPKSSTYLKWQSWYLSQDDPVSILVPPSFANGYCTIKQNSVYHYKLAYNGKYNDADKQFVLKWDDPLLNIPWPFEQPILQERDK